MTNREDKTAIIYKKLVRDRIPEIIRNNGKIPFFQGIDGGELKDAIGEKILEEAFELFNEWKKENKDDILKESADMLEIILTALKPYGFGLNDLLEKMREREENRGGFSNSYFLDQVGGEKQCEFDYQNYPAMVFNPTQKKKFINILKGELKRSTQAWIASAFYSPGTTNLLLSELSQFIENNGTLKIILSTMGNITRPEYFTHIEKHIPGMSLKVFHPPDIPFDQAPPDFHVKAWLFLHRDGKGSLITGSSNFTERGLTKNFEWNYFSSHEINLPFGNSTSPFESAVAEFERIWANESVDVSEEFLEGYRQRWEPTSGWKVPKFQDTGIFETAPGWGDRLETVKPNEAQKEALENLANLRDQNVTKAAVIAATGIGKTYLAAFDYKKSGAKSLLFIAHRENILVRAQETFRIVMNDPSFGAVHGSGRTAAEDCDVVFAMIQTISRNNHLENFLARNFDYIVIDEFHHSEAASYKKILASFTPEFLLGLTATPERMDGRNVLAYCDYNVAYEVRVLEAVDRGWLVPFQYYAVYDETDYEQITWRGTRYDEEELNRALENDTRTAIIAHNLGKYLPSAGKVKALAFCSSVSHARYTAERLSNEYGFPAVALWGESPDEIRHEAISRLQQETDPLNVVCTVDIFNEGVDIPELTHVLFLRPTQSFTVFLQQLGRGLRKAENKDFLVVLDFVGNFRKAHVAPLALCGYTSLVHFLSGSPISFRTTFYERLPDGCYLSPDLDVQRIWEHEIKRVIDVGMTPAERLKLIYRDIKKDLNLEKPLNLMDMVSNAYGVDPYTFFKPGPFENWLRAKKYCEEGYLDANEEALLGTPGEYLLQHIESGLKPVRSYKMVVLQALLKLGESEWEMNEIASEFLSYYLTHKDHLSDYEALARSEDPKVYPLSSVISHIKRMPLDKLSNAENDCFILDGDNNLFKLKPEFVPFWEDPFFRALVMDRVEFTLIRYFERVVDIPYTKKTESGYTAEFRELFKKNPDSLKWEKIFENSGYSGSMEVEILEGDNLRAWTGKKFEDKSRFPARIKAAATGLKCERLMGKYKIIAQGNSLVVRRQ